MPRATERKPSEAMDQVIRTICFVVLSTGAMATIALSVLAEPLGEYFADQRAIHDHEQNLADLGQLYQAQKELLANADNPAVVERIAIDNFNYLPAEAESAEALPLSAAWPDLEQALAQVDPHVKSAPPTFPLQPWIETLAAQRHSQNLLLILGSILAVISLTFFYRKH